MLDGDTLIVLDGVTVADHVNDARADEELETVCVLEIDGDGVVVPVREFVTVADHVNDARADVDGVRVPVDDTVLVIVPDEETVGLYDAVFEDELEPVELGDDVPVADVDGVGEGFKHKGSGKKVSMGPFIAYSSTI